MRGARQDADGRTADCDVCHEIERRVSLAQYECVAASATAPPATSEIDYGFGLAVIIQVNEDVFVSSRLVFVLSSPFNVAL